MEYSIVKYTSVLNIKPGQKIRPVLLLYNKKAYKLENMAQFLKIILYYRCYKNGNMDALYDSIDTRSPIFGDILISRKGYTNDYVKFSPDLFVKVLNRNMAAYLNKIKRWTGGFDLYLAVYDGADDKAAAELRADRLIKENGYRQGSTSRLISSINSSILNDDEKFFRKVSSAFDRAKLIGDIQINDEDEDRLKRYMYNALKIVGYNDGKMRHEKVFALGLVKSAQKNYIDGRFWPGLKDEYGIKLTPNAQKNIGERFIAIMRKNEKPVDVSRGNDYVQNICMHAFVCDKYVDQLFDYMYSFWRGDLSRSLDNAKDEDGNDLFNDLISKIKSSDEKNIPNVRAHTIKAIKVNEKGCKTRLRNILKMIDGAYWDNAYYSSSNRLKKLFCDWLTEKRIKSDDFKSGKTAAGRKANRISRPTLMWSSDKLLAVLPTQWLDDCKSDPVWQISADGVPVFSSRVRLYESTVSSLYTEEICAEIGIENIFSAFDIQLTEDEKALKKTTKIPRQNFRLFHKNGYSCKIDATTKFISKDVSIIRAKEDSDVKCIPEAHIRPLYCTEGVKFYQLDCQNGDILILPGGKALSVGHAMEEGIVGAYPVQHTKAVMGRLEYQVFTKPGMLFFKADRKKLGGTALTVTYCGGQPEFSRINREACTEFRIHESVKNSEYGYALALDNLIKKDGYYILTLDVPGRSKQTYNICYIEDFNLQFVGAPYIFDSMGRIAVKSSFAFRKDDGWCVDADMSYLDFNFDEGHKNDNKYVRDRSLVLPYEFADRNIDIHISLPVLYWKFKKNDNWHYEKPEEISLEKFPSRIYIDGAIDPAGCFVCLDGEQADIISAEQEKLSDGGGYYFVSDAFTQDIDSWDDYPARSLYISAAGRRKEFVQIRCHGEVNGGLLHADFASGRIYGDFEIYGDGIYSASVLFDGQTVDENIPVDDDGKFMIECDCGEGLYTVIISQRIGDDFDSYSLDIYNGDFQLADYSHLDGRTLMIKQIKKYDRDVAKLSLKDAYMIKDLVRKPLSQVDTDELYFWDKIFENLDGSFCAYTGDFGVVTYKFNRLGKVIIIFSPCGQVLINAVGEEGEYEPLIYNTDRKWLLTDRSRLTKREKITSVIPVDDDIYEIQVEIRR